MTRKVLDSVRQLLSRRRALQGVSALVGAAAIGCGDDAVGDGGESSETGSTGDGDGDGDPGDGDGDGDGDGNGSGGRDATGSGGKDSTSGEDPSGGMGGELPNCTESNCDGYCVNDQCFDCVQGDEDKACKDTSTPACLNDGTCAECDQDEHCPEADASTCDTQSHECVGCDNNDDCAHLDDTLLCNTANHACVECTVEDESACGSNSCDPATNTCTNTPRTSLNACQLCQADSECKTNFRCVPMEFQGQARDGGYCLKDVTAGGCTENPYRTATPSRASLSGAAPAQYCSINETLTTCEAVMDLNNDKGCSSADECGVPGLDDGLCETVTFAPNKCTYGCSGASDCKASGSGSSCAGDATGAAEMYCGG